jgi:hypothetical protein
MSYMQHWRDDLQWLADQCATDNVIIAGDFNATVDHMVPRRRRRHARALPRHRERDRERLASAPGRPRSRPARRADRPRHGSVDWKPTGSIVLRSLDGSDSDHRPLIVQLEPVELTGVAPHACETGGMSTTGDSDTIAQTEPADDPPQRQPAPAVRQGFLDTISTGWAERPDTLPPEREQAAYAAARRDAVSAAFAGRRVVVPAGELKQRSNDTDYAFRAHSAFSHLTGWASDSEPGATLVFDPRPDGGHDVTLYFRERADRSTAEFYSNASIGDSGSARVPRSPASPPDLGSRPRTSTRSRPVTTMSSSTSTPT